MRSSMLQTKKYRTGLNRTEREELSSQGADNFIPDNRPSSLVASVSDTALLLKGEIPAEKTAASDPNKVFISSLRKKSQYLKEKSTTTKLEIKSATPLTLIRVSY